jgi:hypothetical protein
MIIAELWFLDARPPPQRALKRLPLPSSAGRGNSSVRVFGLPQLCSKACKDGEEFCHPLQAFQLRLADKLISQPKYIQRMENGSLVQQCSPRGPGLLWDRAELGSLGKSTAAKVRSVGRRRLRALVVCGRDGDVLCFGTA